MKITFVFGSLCRGGAERVIASLANSFVSQGDQVEIVSSMMQKPGYDLAPEIRLVSLNVKGDSANILQALKRNAKAIWALRRYLKEARPDRVVAFSTRMATQILMAFPFRRRFKLIVSERANPKFNTNQNILEKIMGKLCLPSVDYFIFQTDRVKQYFPESIREKSVTIPNGVFSDQIPEEPIPFAQHQQNKICAVGRLTKQKGYDLLIDAFAQFVKVHPGYILNIFGDGSDKARIEQQILRHGIQDMVILHGNVPNVIEQIQDAGMFVMASRFEGMPNALIEAMACGLPCVSTDCDFGPGELIKNGKNGILVPVEDVNALVAAMTSLAEDLSFAEKLGTNALGIRVTHCRERIVQQYRNAIISYGERS